MTKTDFDPLNGIEVRRTPAPSPLGRGITYKTVEVVHYHTGLTAYGCVHCNFTGPSSAKVRAHQMAVHGAPRGGVKPGSRKKNSLMLELVREVERRAKDYDRVCAERDSWKERATKAERSLNTLRRALTT